MSHPAPRRDHEADLRRAADRWAIAFVALMLIITAVVRLNRPIDRDTLAPRPTGYLIPINHAPPGDLEALPGVGPALADAIVDHRSRVAPLQGPADLPDVHGIGPKTAARVAPWVRYSPAP